MFRPPVRVMNRSIKQMESTEMKKNTKSMVSGEAGQRGVPPGDNDEHTYNYVIITILLEPSNLPMCIS